MPKKWSKRGHFGAHSADFCRKVPQRSSHTTFVILKMKQLVKWSFLSMFQYFLALGMPPKWLTPPLAYYALRACLWFHILLGPVWTFLFVLGFLSPCACQPFAVNPPLQVTGNFVLVLVLRAICSGWGPFFAEKCLIDSVALALPAVFSVFGAREGPRVFPPPSPFVLCSCVTLFEDIF